MSDETSADSSELEILRAGAQLNRTTDEALEVALRDHRSLASALETAFPIVARATGAIGVEVETLDETLQDRRFEWGEASPERVRHRLDVAGESFGFATLCFATPLTTAGRRRAASLLETWCEQLDDYLGAIRWAREKHRATRELSEALHDPVLERGVRRAIDRLCRSVPVEDLLLVYAFEEDRTGQTARWIVRHDGVELGADSMLGEETLAAVMTSRARELIDGTLALASLVDRATACEEVLIAGVRSRRVVGRLYVGRSDGPFNPHDRDLVERFGDLLRMRIVDFNREWKHLSLSFAPSVVGRLLAEEGYTERWLEPREAPVAVLFCDISGFTRISARVLERPTLIGQLVDEWSSRAVEIVWAHGGVFDKMVGDCIIALWGPPFFELEAGAACREALAAAVKLRAYTRTLVVGGETLDVTTGLSYCPMFVGRFGPNEDYTGFSAGMNNTARLQGVAAPGQILCMEAFVDLVAEPTWFGSEGRAQVKNVDAPLRFRPLLDRPSSAT